MKAFEKWWKEWWWDLEVDSMDNKAKKQWEQCWKAALEWVLLQQEFHSGMIDASVIQKELEESNG